MILKPPEFIRPIQGHPLGPGRGLVGCWLMNEGSGNKVFDLSGNGNTGIFQADTAWTTGKFGSATIYDGTGDHIAFPNFVRPVNSITLFAWVKLTDVTTYRSILCADDGSEGNTERSFWLRIEQTTGYAKIIVFVGSTAYEIAGTTDVSDGIWHLIIGTYDGNIARIYVDGIEQNSDSSMSGNIDGGTGIAIGIPSDEWTTNYAFKGIIDCAGIFNCALSASEIAQLKEEPFCMFERDM